VLIGAGGHARVVADLLRILGAGIAGVYDADPGRHGTVAFGLPVVGGDDAALALPPASIWAINGVGSIGPATTRCAVYERFTAAGFEFPALVHPTACLSPDAALESGVQVMAGAVVGPGARLGENSLVNTRAVVEHDCRVAAHAHVAPGATLCGGVVVGRAAHVGAGAVVIQGMAVGDGALVAAGAAVVRPVRAGGRVAGVPAREFGA
jgi:UDP-perosamine 4-acetyltransferase